MEIFFHRYRLVPRRALSAVARPGPREGALLRVGEGFADLHPWPELGDPSLSEQLASLAAGRPALQAQASLAMAAADAQARREGRSLFDGLEIPDSHWPGIDAPPEFDTIKVKGLDAYPEGRRLRIDFNATLTPEQFLRIARELPADRVDFVEDPCPWDPKTWRSLREQTGLRLALDLAAGPQPAVSDAWDVLVYKPATGATLPPTDRELVVTSYMDHPVGQLFAAWFAAKRTVSNRCGLMTHVLYEPDAFIERMRRDGARLLPAAGTGIGFDDLLEALPWQKLR